MCTTQPWLIIRFKHILSNHITHHYFTITYACICFSPPVVTYVLFNGMAFSPRSTNQNKKNSNQLIHLTAVKPFRALPVILRRSGVVVAFRSQHRQSESRRANLIEQYCYYFTFADSNSLVPPPRRSQRICCSVLVLCCHQKIFQLQPSSFVLPSSFRSKSDKKKWTISLKTCTIKPANAVKL